MKPTEKEINYTSINSYSTLNALTHQTKNVWFVCHGIGYLSKYFLKYFDELNPTENYIIAAQAPSKYYLGSKYRHVGASWLTKENTHIEIENVINYFDAVFENENLPNNINLYVLGYSQGVSVALRYVAKRKLKCSHLILMSGGIPKELEKDSFAFLKEETKVSLIYGLQDEYFNVEYMKHEISRFNELFGESGEIITFEGKHEVKKELLQNFIMNS